MAAGRCLPLHVAQTIAAILAAVQQRFYQPPAAQLTWKPSERTNPARSQAVVRARASATRACAALRGVAAPQSERGLTEGLQLLPPQPDSPDSLEGGEGEASCATLAWCRLLMPSTAGDSARGDAGEAGAGEPNAAPESEGASPARAATASASCPAAPCWQPAIISWHTPWLCCRRSASCARVTRISSRHDCTSALRSAGVPGTVEAAEACGHGQRTGASGELGGH